MAEEHRHEVVGVCGDVVREVDFCIGYPVLVSTNFGLGPVYVLRIMQ